MIINKAVAITPRILTSIVNLLLTLSQCLALVDLLTSKKNKNETWTKFFTRIFSNFAINTLSANSSISEMNTRQKCKCHRRIWFFGRFLDF